MVLPDFGDLTAVAGGIAISPGLCPDRTLSRMPWVPFFGLLGAVFPAADLVAPQWRVQSRIAASAT